MPQKAFVDALHIAVSAISGIDFLLTWNFKHIADEATMNEIERVCIEGGFECPRLLTPLQRWEPTMWTDPVVEEIHQIRQTMLGEVNGDINALMAKFVANQVAQGGVVIVGRLPANSATSIEEKRAGDRS